MLKSRDQLSSFCLDSCGFQSKHICVTKDWAALSRASVYVSYFTLNTAKFPHAAKNPGKSPSGQKHRARATKRAAPPAARTVDRKHTKKHFPAEIQNSFKRQGRPMQICVHRGVISKI